ncbi:hypothetical protein [Shewanella xiamenensis]|uniref:hypothetical protein n=2 Tax=Shewanella xiamenensis TaxID=332186 RepID=UPI000849838D|nr:hypothetical protein [Shewanella xiamenensis]ODR87427.1 hypothetical protein ABT47_20305 [Shewanella xiamenensis]GGM96980.1 hypothetical protein GCM10009124_27170 [Shewanella xiamenensis]
MNSSMVIKIAIVATVTVGDMDVAVEPIGIYSRRVTGEAMAINPTHLTTNFSRFEAKAFKGMHIFLTHLPYLTK